MKVALSFPGCHRRGGVERIVSECARYLASRHEVTVYANEWDADTDGGIRYRYVETLKKPGFLRGFSYFRSCTSVLARETYDVLNTHGCVCPTGGVHWAQSIHASWLERSKSFRKPLSAARIKQTLNPLHPMLLSLEARHFKERRYSKIIATTIDVKNDLNRYYGTPPEDVEIIPNGFSPAEFNPERRAARRAEMREKLGITPEQIVLLFVANELERKGYATALSAIRQLDRSDVRLLVVGKPPREAVEQQAAQYGVADQVIAAGPTGDVAAFHAAGDIFVLPTQYEAFCLAILEALGSGLPVVTTRIPGAYDAIQVGVNGFLIDDPRSGEQLAAALEPILDHDRLASLSRGVPATVERYRWPNVLERYEQVLLACAR